MAPSSRTPRLSVPRDLGLLLGRVVLGVVVLAHGYQKVFQFGLAGVTQSFEGMGVPAAQIAAPVVSYVELIGGALLILGAFTPVVGLIVVIDMLVAALLVHLPQGVFVDQGGWELVGAIGAGALVLAAVGPGRFSADAALLGRGRTARSRAVAGASAEA